MKLRKTHTSSTSHVSTNESIAFNRRIISYIIPCIALANYHWIRATRNILAIYTYTVNLDLILVVISSVCNCKGRETLHGKACVDLLFLDSDGAVGGAAGIGNGFHLAAVGQMLNRQGLGISFLGKKTCTQFKLHIHGTIGFHFLPVHFKAHVQGQEIIIGNLVGIQRVRRILILAVSIGQLLHHQFRTLGEHTGGGAGPDSNGPVAGTNGGNLLTGRTDRSSFPGLASRFLAVRSRFFGIALHGGLTIFAGVFLCRCVLVRVLLRLRLIGGVCGVRLLLLDRHICGSGRRFGFALRRSGKRHAGHH